MTDIGATQGNQMSEQLHNLWCSLTNQTLHKLATSRVFYDFEREGFTADDLRCVVQYMQKKNKNGDAKYRIQVHKVVGDLEVFASILGDARATERNKRPAPDAKQSAISELRPVVDPEQASTLSMTAGHHISEFLRRP